MPRPQAPSNRGTSPFKLVLAAVLAVVFVVVVAVQFGALSGADEVGTTGSDRREARREPPRRTVIDANVPASPEPAKARRPAPQWPALGLADVLEYDPFAVPAAFLDLQRADKARQRERQTETAARREELMRRQAEQKRILDALRQEGVKAVVGSPRHGHAAIVGSQTVRVGDLLSGFRVTAVEPDGVVLEPLPVK